jgi:hypothetical protein
MDVRFFPNCIERVIRVYRPTLYKDILDLIVPLEKWLDENIGPQHVAWHQHPVIQHNVEHQYWYWVLYFYNENDAIFATLVLS